MTATQTQAVIDAIAGVIKGAIDGHVFAAGITQAVTDAQPLVVPMADDFAEAGMPAVTVAMSPWEFLPQPGNQRQHRDAQCVVWRPRYPLGENLQALYADLDAINAAFVAHARAGNVEPELQSAILAAGPGIVERSIAAGDFLTLPFTVRVVINHLVTYQPA